MKFLFCLSAGLFVSFLAADAYGHFTGKGHVHALSETKQVFLNPNCRSTDTCNLKRFTLTTMVHEVWFADDANNPTYGNAVIMEYETDSVDAIEKYAVVQFVRGCVFNSSKNGEGKIDRNAGYVVPSFGEDVSYCFRQWVIDSQDTDPAYNSDPEQGRFYLLRWNKPGSYDSQTHKFYGAEKPALPVVYMTDYPAGAFVTATGVKNAALNFKTCIYRASDVPAETRREDVNFATPITCFEWQNVYVYDFAKAQFGTHFADWPGQEAPSARMNVALAVIVVALLAALVLVGVLRLTQVPQTEERRQSPG
jgi:hypothetical protein